MSTLETSDSCGTFAAIAENASLNAKLERLRGKLARYGRLAVAFSGGVDSSFLLACAREVLGDDVIALMAISPLAPKFEMKKAEYACEDLDVPLESVEIDVLAIDDVRQNAPDRCYRCKQEMFGALMAKARELGFETLADGTNANDAESYRPGRKALGELGAVSPLEECGFTKSDIRNAARGMGMPFWDDPSCSCLATRIPYGTDIDEALLERIDKAENFLRSLEMEQVRVRVHGDIARIEATPGQIARLADPAMRNEVVDFLKGLGFVYVCVDLEGFRSGSMDSGVADV